MSSPHQGAPVDITLASNCLIDLSIEDRVAVAAAAGYDGIGLSIQEYDRARSSGLTNADIRSLLHRHDVRLTELEAVVAFALVGREDGQRAGLPAPSARSTVNRILEAGGALGAARVQALGTFGASTLEEDAVDQFARLCDAAATHGMSVAIEFLPGTNIPDVATAHSIVAAAGRSNGGLCADSWHFFRGNPDLDILRAVPSQDIVMIQLNDGTMTAAADDYLLDTKNHRLLPGRGEFDLTAFLRAIGPGVPVSAEVLSTELRSLPAQDAATLIAGASRTALSAAHSS